MWFEVNQGEMDLLEQSEMRDKLKLSVVVCTYNRAELLSKCLNSLMIQDIDPAKFEVIVVNNNSKDNTTEVANKYVSNYSNVIVINEYEQGLSHARNCGWRNARSDFVAFIDDDARAKANWCRLIINAFENVNPTPVAVGGKILPIYEVKPPDWFSDQFETRTWGDEKRFLESPDGEYGFSGSNMAFLRSSLKDYNGFNPKYGMQGSKIYFADETDLFMRIYNNCQLFWYDPAIQVFHWTPKRNLTIEYRIKRSYYRGKASAQVRKRKILTIAYLKRLLGTIYLLLLLPFKALYYFRNRKKYLVIEIIDIARKIGYLF